MTPLTSEQVLNSKIGKIITKCFQEWEVNSIESGDHSALKWRIKVEAITTCWQLENQRRKAVSLNEIKKYDLHGQSCMELSFQTAKIERKLHLISYPITLDLMGQKLQRGLEVHISFATSLRLTCYWKPYAISLSLGFSYCCQAPKPNNSTRDGVAPHACNG